MSIGAKQTLLSDIKTEVGEFLTVHDTEQVVEVVDNALVNYDVIEQVRGEIDQSSSDLLQVFLDAKTIEGRSIKTINRYKYIIERALLEINVPVQKITVFHLRRYLMQLKETGLSDSSTEGVRSILSSFFGWLWKDGLLKQNPMANIAPIKCKKEVRLPFSSLDLELIKQACKNDRERALVQFLLSTGCRVGEVCALDISNVDFDLCECKVLGKGNKERIVYIDPVAKLLLKRYLDGRTDNDPCLFRSIFGRITEQGVRAILKKLEERSGVENVHPHRFRRTLATNLIDRGMPIQEVAHILGHDKIDTTMKYVYIEQSNVKSSYRKYTS